METNKAFKRKLAKKIGGAIKFYREKLDLTQEQLANNIGVDRTYIGALEQGAKCGSVYCLYLLSRELEITLKDLFDFKL